ncbi:hypothetical protein ACFVGY_30745 [Streptomyces sp. NPDC127106]|uniref:hypothetical protein n=1 Tax=Streptomyces sp. NPDC127106 TaxID=3345360 RepID=UPI00362BBDE9
MTHHQDHTTDQDTRPVIFVVDEAARIVQDARKGSPEEEIIRLLSTPRGPKRS